MNLNPQLTIVTITKDDAQGLARTLESAANWRSRSDIEHLVVFAGVVDQEDGDSPIIWQQQQSSGIAAAFNEGLERASGEWVWFLNGGDRIHEDLNPDWMMPLLSRTRAEMVTGAVHYDGESSLRTPPPPALQWPPAWSWPAHPGTMVRRRILNEVGGFDERWKVCMDFDLWYRVIGRATSVDVLSVPFARFDMNGVSSLPENYRLICKENSAVLWRYKFNALRSLACSAGRLLRVWLRGL